MKCPKCQFENPVLDQFYEACMGTVHLNRQEQDDLLTKVGFKKNNECRLEKEFSTSLRPESKAI